MSDSSETKADVGGEIEHAAELNAFRNDSERHTSIIYNGGNGFGGSNRCLLVIIVYWALFLDNVLLTAIVPILPDYLAFLENQNHDASTNINPLAYLSYAQYNNRIIFNPSSLYDYRNNRMEVSSSQPHPQTISTKHPIPGKSMVNFSMLQSNEGKSMLNSTDFEQNHPLQLQQKQEYLTRSENAYFDTKNKILDSNDSVPNHSKGPSNSKSLADESENLNDENGSIGLLLAMKALVQLIFNPIVGNMSSRFGYRFPMVVGTFLLLVSSMVFVLGQSYMTLLLGRGIHGIASACIGVCGMSLVAQHYPEEDRRSKVMGIILGSIALGVLIGYPFGGLLYDASGKAAPFLILSTFIFLNFVIQLITVDLSEQPEVITDAVPQKPSWKPLFHNKMILAIIAAIWVSTSTMAILEPCLPIWLIQHIKPSKWQIGTVFIPDSVGYFVGTNFFGSIAYKYGQIKMSSMSLVLVGISAALIPSANTVTQLLVPHFCLGLGIGIIDAALVPLLATIVDATLDQEESNDADCNGAENTSYGTVYCLQQTSVSLAYCLAPLIGGELAETFGFTWLMRIVGFFNIAYGPLLAYIYRKLNPMILREKYNEMKPINSARDKSQYKQFYNSVETE